MNSTHELDLQKNKQYELKNNQTIELFGEEKCLKAYELTSTFIPLKMGQKHSSLYEKIADVLNVSEDEALDLWDAGNYIIQKKQENDNKGVIEKYGKDKVKLIYKDITEMQLSNENWTKLIPKKHNISSSDATEIFLAGITTEMRKSAPDFVESVREDHNNKHNLPTCPKKECDGKLHMTFSQTEEFNGLYICDACNGTFEKTTPGKDKSNDNPKRGCI